MRARALVVAVAASLFAVACGGSKAHTPSSSSASSPAQPVFAVAWGPPGHGDLFQADPRTLAPLAGKRHVEIASGSGGGYALSPDARTLAIGTGASAGVQLIDVTRMRSLARIKLLSDGYVDLVSWPVPDRLFVNIPAAAPLVAVVDPLERRLVKLHHLPGQIVAARPAPAGLVLLLGPDQTIGPAQIAVVSAEGVQLASVSAIRAGWATVDEGGEFPTPRQQTPGFAIDPSGRRALVVSAAGLVADVDLRTLDVRYHTLSRPVSLLGRLRNWLEPSASAKAISGQSRAALWLNDHLVAITGIDMSPRPGESGVNVSVTPAGLSLIDTGDWSIRELEDNASDMALAAGTLLAFGGSKPNGLVGYDLDGHERFHILENEDVGYVMTAGGYAYVGSGNSTYFQIVDVRSGRRIGTAATAEPTILVP